MHRPPIIDAVLTYGTFPVMFTVVMGLGMYAIAHGWDPAATAMGLTASVVLALLVLERVHCCASQCAAPLLAQCRPVSSN